MRKKSHISLTKGVVHGLDAEKKFGHRFSLYVGSILPDCTPSFLTRRHCMDDTFNLCEKKMEYFLEHFHTKKKGVSILSSIRMGEILHYVADYFTYPHNSHYPGNLKEHCRYEEALKHRMRSFVRNRHENDEQQYDLRLLPSVHSLSELLAYIREKHDGYMHDRGDINLDCAYSYIVSLAVMHSLLQLAGAQA